ncbi:MAG: hypothetical protein ACK4YP_06130 [Myxococcota bacterium]
MPDRPRTPPHAPTRDPRAPDTTEGPVREPGEPLPHEQPPRQAPIPREDPPDHEGPPAREPPTKAPPLKV